MGIGDWGLGIGDWGLGIGPNPQSPIPNPHENNEKSFLKIIKLKIKIKIINFISYKSITLVNYIKKMKSVLVFILCFITISCVTDNVRKAWNYLTKHGLTKAGAAGLLGNLQAESGVRPDIYERSKRKKIGLSDADYVKKTNNGSYKNFVNDRAGFGIAQWTYPTRKKNLLNHCKGKIGDLDCQLSFLLQELKGYKSVYKALTTSSSVKICSNQVMLKFERPANQSPANQNRRAAMGQKIYNELAKK